MIRSKDMAKLSLFAYKQDREKIIEKLHGLGMMQIKDIKIDNLPYGQAEELRDISDYLLRVSRIVNVLKMPPRKPSFKQGILGLEIMGKRGVKKRPMAKILSDAQAFLKKNEVELISLEERHDVLREKISNVADMKRIVEILERNNIPPSMPHETGNLMFLAGLCPKQKTGSLRKELTSELGDMFIFEAREDSKKNDIIFVSALRQDSGKVSFIVKKFGVNIFPNVDIPAGVDPLSWIEEKERGYEKELLDVMGAIRKRYEIFDDAIVLREELEILKERYDAVHKFQESAKFFVLQGWALAKDKPKLIKAIPEATIVEEEIDESDNVPVELSNLSFLRPFENLTELYSLPKYKELDPTFIVGPLFLIYAGFMLTDFVYGLGFLILGLAILILFSKYSKSMRDISISILGIGFFSMVFGVLTGSYLGDATAYILGKSSQELAIWKDPLSDPMYFLIIALAVGVIHINIALLLGLTENVRKKEWKELFFERIVWWLLQAGIAVIAMKSALAVPFQPWVVYAGWSIAIFAVIMLVIANGPLGLLNITGFMGDIISYSRLFALALSTAGIAMTVNLLADMLSGVPYIGILLAALLAITGHLFSFAMNGLGSFVHSIRLQFVEFFGKFYQGGGDRFAPYKEERVYTEVKE